MIMQLDKCEICPRNCKINRNKNQIGWCKSTDRVKIGLYSTHDFEEPCISGEKGSGTIFFSNCTMNCIFCQNYEISQLGKGKEISIEELSNIFIKQQEKGVHNINLVTPTSYVYQIIEAIKIAKAKGLTIPIVYNTSGYEKIETIRALNGYVDIYLPDLKYAEDELAIEFSNAKNYFKIATTAIKEMIKQVGTPKFNENGIIQKGVIIRHLVLPNFIENSKKILLWIKQNLPNDIYVSIMAQYFPTYKAKENAKLNRKLTKYEWEQIEKYIEKINIENGFIQELGEHEEEFVPKWDI